MRYVKKYVAVTLSLLMFVMCSAPCGFAAADQKGSKIEIRMTKEIPITSEPKSSTTQWIKDNKWWIALGLALAGGAAAAAGGGGGGGGASSNTDDPNQLGTSETGSVTVGW